MSPQRWQKVREAFDKAVACPPAEADEVLREACGEDTGLYEEVRRMLGEHERSSPLDRAVWERGSVGVFSVGQTVAGRYRILRYLSHGGMGEVYEAEDLELGGHVAVKTLLPEIAGDSRMIARFKQEIQLSREISDPHVCRVFDLARHPVDGSSPDTVFFLTMEFLAGETLAARLEREGRMTAAEALPVVAQIAQALDAAHRKGVVHRDLKPSNVMLTPAKGSVPPCAVVTDFGLARRSAPEKETTASLSGRVMGTVDYMAPELLTGAQATFASDIYALGMVAYKMVTGALPFASDTPLAAAILRSKEPIPSPKAFVPGLDAKWERAILRGLDANPARRFSTAREFIAALGGEATAFTLAMPQMTRRRWAAVAALAVVFAGAWIGWGAWSGERHRPSPEAETLYRKGVDDIGAGAYFAATKALEESVQLAPHFALAHARLAEAWVELEMPEKAQEQMLLARREDVSKLARMDRLQIEAIDLTITRDFAAAAGKYEQMAKVQGAGAGLAVDLGRAYEKAGKPDNAIDTYRRAAEGPAHNPAAWLRLGVLYGRQSKTAASDAAFAQAEKLYQLTSNLEGLTELAIQRGVALTTRGSLPEARDALQKAVDHATLAGNLQQTIAAELRLSTVAYLMGDAATTELLARKAVDTARENRMESLAIRGVIRLGDAHMRRRDFEAAEKFYDDALGLARREQSAQLEAFAHLSLASFDSQRQRPDDSIREAEAALRFYRTNRYAKESIQCLTLLGRAKRDQGHTTEALDVFHQALDIAEKDQDHLQMAIAHESIGSILFSQEQYPQALVEYRENLRFAPDAEHVGYAALQCGNTLWRLGQYDEARAMFQKADEISRRLPALRIELLYGEAGMLLSENRWPEALRTARLGLDLEGGKSPGEAARLHQAVGLALAGAGDRRGGLAHCEQALQTARSLGLAEATVDAALALLQVAVEGGDQRQAMSLYHGMDPMLGMFPESRWRFLALASHFDPTLAPEARQALDSLAAAWGPQAFTAYRSRPDIARLSRPILQTQSAK